LCWPWNAQEAGAQAIAIAAIIAACRTHPVLCIPVFMVLPDLFLCVLLALASFQRLDSHYLRS
jgi:hypothetical protein